MGKAADIAIRAFEAMDRQDYDEVERLTGPDLNLRVGTTDLHGFAELLPMLEAHYAAFPDSVHEFLGTVEEGDRVAVELRILATFENPFTSDLGTFEPSGEPVSWLASDFLRVAGDRVVEWHTYIDGMEIHRAVGYEPKPIGAEG